MAPTRGSSWTKFYPQGSQHPQRSLFLVSCNEMYLLGRNIATFSGTVEGLNGGFAFLTVKLLLSAFLEFVGQQRKCGKKNSNFTEANAVSFYHVNQRSNRPAMQRLITVHTQMLILFAIAIHAVTTHNICRIQFVLVI